MLLKQHEHARIPVTLHVFTPSIHVWPNFSLTLLAQLPNHVPPRPQQLDLPVLSMVPHLGHTAAARVVIVSVIP